MKITLGCGCPFTGTPPDLSDPGLLAWAPRCPNGHGLQDWTDTTIDAALAWLAAHPDSSARTVAAAIGEPDDRYVFHLLTRGEAAGRCQRTRGGLGAAWLWEVPA